MIMMTKNKMMLSMQEESPEGGRFKKEVVVDGHSYLLLIRDEGGPPELQVNQTRSHLCFWYCSCTLLSACVHLEGGANS